VSSVPRIAASAAAVPGDRLQRIHAVLARRCEVELLLDRIQELVAHLLPDAHRTVALHVAMATDRGCTGPRLSDVAAQQQQVDELLEGRDRILLLGETHGPGDDDAVSGDVACSEFVDLRDIQSGRREHFALVEVDEVGAEGLESDGLIGEERVIEHGAGVRVFGIEDALRQGLEKGHVTGGADLQELVGHLRSAADDPVDPLRVLVALETGLRKRIHRHDLRALALRILEGCQHARVIGARILPHHDDQVGVFEVVVGDGRLADPDDLAERETRRLVAHVRAVGQVVRPECPREQLVDESRLVSGPAARVEGGLIRRIEALQLVGGDRDGLIPAHRHIVIGSRSLIDRFGEATLHPEPVLRPGEEVGYRMLLPEA
jgi:hypothetical protein